MPPTHLSTDIQTRSEPATEPGWPAADAYRRTFAATVDQVGEARRFLADILTDHPATADAVLCLDEICANAVLHGNSARPGGTFTVSFRRSGPAIRVEVTDQGGRWRIDLDGDAEHGRGLYLVRALTARRGITMKGPRDCPYERTVWYEMLTP